MVVVAIFASGRGCGCGCFPSRTTDPEAKMNCFEVFVLLLLCWTKSPDTLNRRPFGKLNPTLVFTLPESHWMEQLLTLLQDGWTPSKRGLEDWRKESAEKTIEQASTVSWVMQRAQQACLLLIVSRRIRGRAARTNPCGMFATVGGWQLTLIFEKTIPTLGTSQRKSTKAINVSPGKPPDTYGFLEN